MKLKNYNNCQKTTNHAKRLFNRTTWVVWANNQFATVRFLSLSFFVLIGMCTGRNGGLILTSVHARICLLGVLLIDLPIYGGQIPPKHAKYSNFHIIKITAWIPTKFYTPVKTTKCASWMVQKRIHTHTQHTHTAILWLTGFCPGQPRWAATRRNIRPLTPIVVISHPLSASSIYYDP